MENESNVDRSRWSSGPWDNEPDRVEFEHAGFPCIVQRVESGHLCGYVAVPPGHPWHGKAYDEVDADVHGGLTYAEKCGGKICHIPKPGESDDVWWLGFDHAHGGDMRPGDEYRGLGWPGATYKGINYVKGGCERLAEQAKAAA